METNKEKFLRRLKGVKNGDDWVEEVIAAVRRHHENGPAADRMDREWEETKEYYRNKMKEKIQ